MTQTSRSLHEAALGAGVLLVGALLALGALSIPGEAGYGGVGPGITVQPTVSPTS